MTDQERLPSSLEAMLGFIQDFIIDHGYAPSVREIGSVLGIPSTSTVHAQLRRLEDAGAIRRDPAKPRAMALQNSPLKLPPGDKLPDDDFKGLIGQSGQSLFCNDSIILPVIPFARIPEACSTQDGLFGDQDFKSCVVPKGALKSGPCFITIMPDDSMSNRQIYAGDYLIVSRQGSANNNDMIIGSLDNGLLIRSYTKGLRQVRLQVESNEFVISTVDPEDLTIYGVVVGALRLFS